MKNQARAIYLLLFYDWQPNIDGSSFPKFTLEMQPIQIAKMELDSLIHILHADTTTFRRRTIFMVNVLDLLGRHSNSIIDDLKKNTIPLTYASYLNITFPALFLIP